MKKHPIKDQRYSVEKEFCGYSEARYVLRFCGEWVMQSPSYSACVVRAASESAQRRGCAIVHEVTP